MAGKARNPCPKHVYGGRKVKKKYSGNTTLAERQSYWNTKRAGEQAAKSAKRLGKNTIRKQAKQAAKQTFQQGR